MDPSILAKMADMGLHDDEGLMPTIIGPCLQQPVNNHDEEKQAVYLGRLAVKIGIETMKALEAKKYTLFDSLVSECQCQLRAVMISEIVTNMTFSPSALQQELMQLDTALAKKAESLELAKRNLVPHVAKTVSDVVGSVVLPKGASTLILCYMLDKVRVSLTEILKCHNCDEEVAGLKETTDCCKLSKYQKLSDTKLFTKIVEVAKAKLSQISCKNIQRLAGLHSSALTQVMLSDANKILTGRDPKKFSCPKTMLPCFYTLMTSVECATIMQIPIVVKNKRTDHTPERLQDLFDVAFLYSTDGLTPLDTVPADDRICIVIDGQRTGGNTAKETSAEYIKRLNATPFSEILAMNGAHHSQYTQGRMLESVPLLQTYTEEKARLDELKERAEKEGCCDSKQTLFKITHIYCDTIANQQKEMTTCLQKLKTGLL